ncbi:MAG: Gfo/Idh/MocA family protein, partial [Methanobacterium sp.]
KESRRKESKELYNIKTIKDIDNINFDAIDAFIVSTPPDKHDAYIELAINKNKPVFVEASVILDNLENLDNLSKEKNIIVAPSSTMIFHPAIKDIKKIIKSDEFGKITNFSYHSGQYLKDWHPWEEVADFYVSNKDTGGCREIVPYELTWLVNILGFPIKIIGFKGHSMDVGADIDDTYVMSLNFGNFYGNLTVDVVSRNATRNLIINMEYGQILWNMDEKVVKLYSAIEDRWIYYYHPEGTSITGYSKNINEDMYVEELESFIKAIKEESEFPNSLEEDIKVLKLLYEVENQNDTF